MDQGEQEVYAGYHDKIRKHGFGHAFYVDGSSYTGHWNLGVRHGKGIQRQKDGTIQKGLFMNGKFKLAHDFVEDQDYNPW